MERRNPPQVSAGLHISLRDEDDLEEEEEEEYDKNESELVVVDDEWVPLQSHPAFSRRWRSTFTSPHSPFRQLPLNYMAWDSNSQRLYVWDPKNRHLFCLTLRFCGHSIEAASKSKIFFLFTDGSIYVLCPIVPFGSIYFLASIQEIYKNAYLFGLRSSNSNAVNNASLAVNWLESTFPELASKSLEGGVVKAHPYVPIGTSLSLQGPLCRLCSESSDGVSEQNDAQQAGRGQALAFFCNTILKDTIIATAWSSGLLEIDALADELQPVWNYGSSPRLHVDDFSCVIGVAMICEQNLEQDNGKIDKLIQAVDAAWMGYTPPPFRLPARMPLQKLLP